MFRYRVVFAFLTIAVVVAEASGQVPVVTLDEAMRLFAANNLDLRLARSDLAQATGVARQARAWPNPSLDATHEPLRAGDVTYSETYLTASQRVELPGSRGSRIDVGERRREAASWALRADSARLAFEVRRAYVEAASAQEMLAVTGRIASLFRDAERSADERLAAGDISLYALRRIGVERARYETLSVDAELRVLARQSDLALLIDPEGDESRIAAEPLGSTPPTVEAEAFTAGAADRRPELAEANATVQAEEAQARLSRANRLPDVTATGGLKRQSDGLRGAFLGLSFPVPVFDRGGGAIEAADAVTRAAEERRALTRRQLDTDVRHTIETYSTLRRRAEIPPVEAPGENDLLDIALVAYEEGEMELVELLDAADALHDARTAESRLRASLWIAYYDLERAVGGFDTTTEADR